MYRTSNEVIPLNEMIIVALIGGLLGGSTISALVNQIGDGIREKKRRQYDRSDEKDKELEALKAGMKWVIFDRIRFIGHSYIKAKEIDFDDRRILNEMHKCYHDGLNGNGDLDNLMHEVNSLPLK